MQKMIEINKAADLLGKSGRHLRRLCAAGKVPGSAKRSGTWHLPASYDARLTCPASRCDIDTDALADIAASRRQAALERLGIIKQFETFAASFTGSRTDAYTVFAANSGVAARTLRRWIARYKTAGLTGLVDTRGTGGKTVTISPAAWELFKSMYLAAQQLSAKTCWQNICFINTDRDKHWKIPGLQSMYRLVDSAIPMPVKVLLREGRAAYDAKCAPYINIDPDSIAPGAVFVGDHHQFNCWIRHRGSWIRPWITAWLDMRSRCVVGFYITPTPNQTTILQAFKRAAEKYGPPEGVKIDNGRDYDSELFTGTTKVRRRKIKAGMIDERMVTGLYAMMDISVSFSIRYHPQSKCIERWFDTLDRQFTKTIATYCGKDSARKPEKLNEQLQRQTVINSAYDLESFDSALIGYIDAYNNTAHTGRGMDSRSPAAVMATRTSRRMLAEGVLDLLMRVWSGELTVGKNGVRFKNIFFGQFEPALLSHQGKKVRLAYDPDDLRQVWVYDAATLKLICIADQARLAGYADPVSEDYLRLAMRQKSRAVKAAKAYADSRLTANMDLTDLTIRAMADAAEQRPEPERPAAIRPLPTVFDRQVTEHVRLDLHKKVRKAAGAESTQQVLDIDLAAPRKSNNKINLGLFKK